MKKLILLFFIVFSWSISFSQSWQNAGNALRYKVEAPNDTIWAFQTGISPNGLLSFNPHGAATTTAVTQLLSDSSHFIANTEWVKMFSASLKKYFDPHFFINSGAFGDPIGLDTVHTLATKYDLLNVTGLPSMTGQSGKFLTNNGTIASWATIAPGGVTSLSIASANGFAGSSSGGTTPILTLQTSITGLLKGNGTAISAATAGTDYLTPTGSAAGLTGLLSSQVTTALGFTPFAYPLVSNGDLFTQISGSSARIGIGANGTILMSNGSVASWTNAGLLNQVTGDFPSGTINGSNTTFTLTGFPITGSVSFYYNGILQHVGSDYTISGSTITTTSFTPVSGDVLLANYNISAGSLLSGYLTQNGVTGSCTNCNLTYVNGQLTVAANGSGGGLTASNFIFNEVPSGTINGVNVTFTLANTPTSGTVRLYKNGLRLTLTTDYTISGSTITYAVAPSNTGFSDVLIADYLK